MKTIFWLAVTLESAGLVYFIRKAWLLLRADQRYVYPEYYRQVFYPILVLSVLLIASLLIKYYFHSDRPATFVALLPVIMLVLALVGIIVGTILVGGKWH
ncbi:hypothetical protein [Dyadobacter endophyticus]|uniref:Branched-chain amino acid transport protein (AzlD) n=1 Tax=Dyadobacter endophyticus TaxID=1749036 RepID=A0ABQ1YV16_9BACT|nr:hypothetical protein [Dyadobacter endophyticus]GGH37127.1 hypothetical protein GCM10007423_29930 [Dyadobacter endophyticus]